MASAAGGDAGEPDEARHVPEAAAGGAARAVLRNALLTVTRRASIGQLPLRQVAKLSNTADAAVSILDSAHSSSAGGGAGARTSSAARALQAGRFAYSFVRSAFLGTVLFASYDALADRAQQQLRPSAEPPLEPPVAVSGGAHAADGGPSTLTPWDVLGGREMLVPFTAGAVAGAAHGTLEHGMDTAEAAWARRLALSQRQATTNAPAGTANSAAASSGGATPGARQLRGESLRSYMAAVGRHSASHAVLFGLYYNVSRLVMYEEEDKASLEAEYGHVLVGTIAAGLIAGVAQEAVNAAALRQVAPMADLRKAGLASVVGFLALEFAKFDDDLS